MTFDIVSGGTKQEVKTHFEFMNRTCLGNADLRSMNCIQETLSDNSRFHSRAFAIGSRIFIAAMKDVTIEAALNINVPAFR